MFYRPKAGMINPYLGCLACEERALFIPFAPVESERDGVVLYCAGSGRGRVEAARDSPNTCQFSQKVPGNSVAGSPVPGERVFIAPPDGAWEAPQPPPALLCQSLCVTCCCIRYFSLSK